MVTVKKCVVFAILDNARDSLRDRVPVELRDV
jgi:hypothetical protein